MCFLVPVGDAVDADEKKRLTGEQRGFYYDKKSVSFLFGKKCKKISISCNLFAETGTKYRKHKRMRKAGGKKNEFFDIGNGHVCASQSGNQ